MESSKTTNPDDRQADELTIDELGDAAGVPTRTIREYQRLGLLNPPRRDGRVGKYGTDHQARLAIIARLQDRGYSLAAIGDLIHSWEQGRGLGSVLGVDPSPAVLDETPTEITREQLNAAVAGLADPAGFEEAIDAGLIQVGDDARIMVRSVAALGLVGLATQAGMPTDAAIEIASAIRSGAADIARTVVDRFMQHLWASGADNPDLAATLSRARLLLAQAAASLVVHELGVALYRHADEDPGGTQLHALVDQVAIGAVRTLTAAAPREHHSAAGSAPMS
ncbi:MAG TPA: MerR family transcriptional regulator [Acidimicrobiia bacterium]|nr:MerR family transcriptional regulator [Acidimicrobiia bacterium]